MSSLHQPTTTVTESAEPVAPGESISLVETATVEAATSFVDQLVGRCAVSTPRAPALISGSELVTYGDLDRRANQIAHHLRSAGVGRDVPVGLCMERSASMVVAALAILKAGGAYLPLDPAYPVERLSFMLQDANVRLLITSESTGRRIPAHGCSVIDVDKDAAEIAKLPITAPQRLHQPQDLAYVIYTSGSDGQPKGVQITHAGLLNLIRWHQRAFSVTPNDRASQLASISFDAAAWELWPYLASGASITFCDEMTRLTAQSLREWLLQSQITIGFVPTALAERLMAIEWPASCGLRVMLTGADTLHRRPPAGLPFKVINNYGPTECTVVATSGLVSPVAADATISAQPSIGKAIDNVQIYILNEAGGIAASGTVGEIAIGGAGLARGYVNRPDLNQQQFIINHLNSDERLYRTGDFGRQLDNGEIQFLGRRDHQIKVRGFRVEPDEIVGVLNQSPHVQASAVISRDDLSGNKQLIAYVVPADGARLSHTSLLTLCSENLPEYMRPALFVSIDELPLNHNGKVDRAGLPAPVESNIIRDDARRTPVTPAEIRIVALLSELLGVPSVGVDDNFFFLGGHSLLGTQLITRLRDGFGVELTLRQIFDSPTAAELALVIDSRIAGESAR